MNKMNYNLCSKVLANKVLFLRIGAFRLFWFDEKKIAKLPYFAHKIFQIPWFVRSSSNFQQKKDLGLLSVIPQIPSLLVPRTVKPCCMCLSAAQRCVLIKYCPATIQYLSKLQRCKRRLKHVSISSRTLSIFEKSSLKPFFKNQVGQNWFLVYFELDFYCLCNLQKSSSK